ncbi:MAG: hypothetical protein KUG81_03500 [Gammaproteobacteria bacterium]|nr:hypothetical protein [Gammaproteobacteria bacterium]
MKTNKFIRRNRIIHNVLTDEVKSYKSVNLAKKESMRLQKAQGSLGDGFLRRAS